MIASVMIILHFRALSTDLYFICPDWICHFFILLNDFYVLLQGCRLDFEFVAKGMMYRKGRMKITVSKIHRQISANAENCEPLTNSHLVKIHGYV
jgi:hypothetical protein